MKILKYSLLFFSIVGLSTFFSCGSDSTDPTIAQLIAADGIAWKVKSSSTDAVDSNFRLTFSTTATDATTFSLTAGTMPSPAFNTCSATSGDWTVGGSLTNGVVTGTVTFVSGGKSSAVNASYDGATQELTLSWNAPHPDDEPDAGCGDKNTSAHSYVLEKNI